VELNTIDNSSADGSAGYQNFTCSHRTDLIVGVIQPITIATGGVNPHDIRVYLDANNDGTLTSSEQIFQRLGAPSPGVTGTFSLPTGTVLNQPLRLRIVADAIGNNPGPCSNPVSGQVEDYTVVARPNTLPPNINFSSNYVPGGCVNPVQFTDLTTNLPTSWLWDFGDGNTSTLQNPSHQYTASGSYNVSLSATNTNGTASITRLNAVDITIPCLTYCNANGTGGFGPGGVQQPSPFWMTAVRVSNAQPTYNNVTGNAPNGYATYASRPIVVNSGSRIDLTVVTNLAIVHRTSVWVDWNMNGIFDSFEIVADGVTANGPNAATFTASFTAPAPTGPLNTRMRVIAVVNNNFVNPCGVNIFNAEVEDYQLRVQPLSTRNALALPALSLFPNPTLDGRVHLRLTDAAAAGTYAAEVQNLLGAAVLRTSLRLNTTTDTELDLSRLAPGIYVLRLRNAQGQTVVRRVVRE
jgi:PKD repeat protein